MTIRWFLFLLSDRGIVLEELDRGAIEQESSIILSGVVAGAAGVLLKVLRCACLVTKYPSSFS
jgi:hypothetical protein